MNRLAESSGLAPLRHRDFRLLFFGRVVSFAGSAMAPVALAFAVLGIGVRPRSSGSCWHSRSCMFVSIAAQLLSRAVRELPRLPPEPAPARA